MIDPLSVVCQACSAAIGARCTRSVKDGSKFINEFHQARIDAITEAPPIAGAWAVAQLCRSNDCYFGRHEKCVWPSICECSCHRGELSECPMNTLRSESSNELD
jgi:hypothetical protein